MSVEFYEEFKWKKALSHSISTKNSFMHKKRIKNKRLDRLYEACINFSLNPSGSESASSSSSFQMPKYPLTQNPEYLLNKMTGWKNELAELKEKLFRKFKESKLKKAEKLIKVIKSIQDLLERQESLSKQRKKEEEKMHQETGPLNLSEFEYKIETIPIHETNLFSEYAENLNKDYFQSLQQLNDLIKAISNEVNLAINDEHTTYHIDSLIPSQQTTHKKTMTSLINTTTSSSSNEPNTTQALTLLNNNNNNKKEHFHQSPNDIEMETIENIDFDRLFFTDGELSKSIQDFQKLFSKFYNTDKIEMLPNYNYSKMLGSSYDCIQLNNQSNIKYKNLFPPVYYEDDLFSKTKKLFENEIEWYKKKHLHSKKNFEANVEYEKFTSLQKTVFLWAISLYGTNPYVINSIINMFAFTKNIDYEVDEINYITERLLHEIHVDLYGSNFNLLQPKMFDKVNLNIEAPVHIASTSNFHYNQILKQYVNGSINNIKIIPAEPKCSVYFGSVLKDNSIANQSKPISFLNGNPLFKNAKMKQRMYEGIKKQIISICTKVEMLSGNNLSEYDYYNMNKTKRQKNEDNKYRVNDLNDYPQIKEMKGKKLTKEDLMKEFSASENSVDNMSCVHEHEKWLESIKPVPSKVLEIVSFFAQDTIKKGWDNMRDPWYQNNWLLNPKYKKKDNTKK
jgi:hypothetical protein